MSLDSISGNAQDVRRIIQRLESQVAQLQRDARAIPARMPAGGGSQNLLILLVGASGNTLLATIAGVQYKGIRKLTGIATITSVPVAVPVPATAYADGLGHGYIANDLGTETGSPVWIASAATPSGGTRQQDSTVLMLNGMNIVSSRSVQLPVGAGPATATVYLVYAN